MNIYLLDLSPMAMYLTCGPKSVQIKRFSSIKVTLVLLILKNCSAPMKFIFNLSGESARGEIFSGEEKFTLKKGN